MIFNQYDPAEVEFAYQVSTVLSLSILAKFYGLGITSDQKDKLIDGLLLMNSSGGNMGDGSFLPEIPSLVFCLHLLKTETNAPNLAAAVNNLSMVYLLSIGERIDALAVSNLLAAWNEVGEATQTEQGFDLVKQLVLDKAKEGAFFSKGCGTALVNIIKSCTEMQYCDAEFLDCILGGL